MLKEYAVQPELLSSWPVFRYLSDKFGYGRGRVFAEYPKTWRKRVYESLGNCKTMEKKRIEAGLIKLRSALYPRHYEWDKDKGWLDNAIEEHTKVPFARSLLRTIPMVLPRSFVSPTWTKRLSHVGRLRGNAILNGQQLR